MYRLAYFFKYYIINKKVKGEKDGKENKKESKLCYFCNILFISLLSI